MFKYYLFFVMLFLCIRVSYAQLTDNFSDGNFSSNPSWNGDINDFTINPALQLQLNSQGENTSALTTPVSLNGSTEWSFWVKLAFSPSDNNQLKIYLMSDQENLKGALNGYLLKFGESGAEDAVELYRQSGTTLTRICRGTNGLLASSFSIRVRVRYSQGEWKIWTDPAGGEDYQPEASGNDPVIVAGGWMGICCKYTTSNSTRFYFDDFYAGPLIIDSIPPELKMAGIRSPNSLRLNFSERISSATASVITNYSADNGMGNPVMISQDSDDPSIIDLYFAGEFQSDVTYTLTVSGLADFAGNTMPQAGRNFSWHDIRSYELLITEIMCDPEPAVHLPAYEYLEIFNNSKFEVNLEGWSLVVGATIKTLPAFILEAGKYVLVSDDAALPALRTFGDVITFGSFYLTNAGMSLTLRSPEQKVVFHLDYTDRWYRDDYKKEGGWSLEMIDPQNPCGGAANWMASMDPSGGTPGRNNSVAGLNPDHQPPLIASAGIIDPHHILLGFNESMDTATLKNTLAYGIDQEIGNPLSVMVSSASGNKVVLEIGKELVRQKIYNLEVTGILADCAGNQVSAGTRIRFAIPELPEVKDLVLNELLFNPGDGCVDFVEIYNRSMNTLDLADVTLAEIDTATGDLSSVSPLSFSSKLIFPGDYIAFATDTAGISACYRIKDPHGLMEIADMPQMANSSGSVAVAGKSGKVLDCFSYDESMHYPLLINDKGVSLERINPENPSQDPSNWHSAAEAAGYGTPGYRNSQYCMAAPEESSFTLSPDIFSPDNDGYDDILLISYDFDEPGYNVSVRIFNLGGTLVRNLVPNSVCGLNGSWTWDGTDDNRNKAPIGRYIVFVESFNLEGKVKRYKLTTVLGGYL